MNDATELYMNELDAIYAYAVKMIDDPVFQLCASDCDIHGFFPCLGHNESDVKKTYREAMKELVSENPGMEVRLIKFSLNAVVETFKNEPEHSTH